MDIPTWELPDAVWKSPTGHGNDVGLLDEGLDTPVNSRFG
jgi:hypothetical protein